MADTFKQAKTLTYPNAVVRVFAPELTAEERTKRMKRIYEAAEALLKSERGVTN